MSKPTKYGFLLCVFLILLRLTIGWHFFVSGADKIKSRSDPSSPDAWTSKGFLENSTGPLKGFFQSKVGDPDQRVLALLEVKQPSADAKNGKDTYKGLISEELSNLWDDYTNRFIAYYSDVTEEQKKKGMEPLSEDQKKEILAKRDQAKIVAAQWLLGKEPKGEALYYKEPDLVAGATQIPMTVPEQIREYKDKLKKLKTLEENENFVFKQSISSTVPELRSDVYKMRGTLLSDLNAILLKRLNGVLTEKQKSLPMLKSTNLSVFQLASLVKWTDRIISWGLAIVGGCLVLGLLTRTACVLGALFLISVFVVSPPPYWSEVARAEGMYSVMFKNVLMVFALFALALTPSGRWLGLDGLVSHFSPFKKNEEEEKE